MKLILTISFVIIATISNGQKYNTIDSIENPKVVSLLKELFRYIDDNDVDSLRQLSSEDMYCILCFDKPDMKGIPYMSTKESFYNLHYKELKKTHLFELAKKSKEIIVTSHFDELNRSSIIVLFTIYEKDELALGHEGGQLGLYFKVEKGELKFSGIETIP